MRFSGFCRTMTALSGAFMLTMPVMAQADKDPPASASDPSKDIVITGQVETPPATVVQKQARSITLNGGPVFDVPLAQFQDKVCPGVINMPIEIAEVIVSRIRSNAEHLGIDVAREGKCEPNIIVAFVVNGQEMIKDFQKRKGYLFKDIPHAEAQELAKDPGPVHAWVNTVTRSRHGDVLRGDDDAGLGNPPILYVANSHSHIYLASRLDITSSVVVIDLKAANGLSAVQLADYATMRTFARTLPASGDEALSTILGLFSGGSEPKPFELTDFDLAYLRAVYGGIPNINTASKLGRIGYEMKKQQAERADEK